MAVIKRGILGGVQNKIGNVVGSSWKGIATLRSLPLSVANPKTAAQTNVRTKFSEASKTASTLLATIVKPLWDRFAQQQSGYNAWIQANIDAFSSAGFPSYADMIMSKGALAVSPITSAVYDESSETTTIDYTAAPGGDANPTDIAFVTIANIDDVGILQWYGFQTVITRSAGQVVINQELAVGAGEIYVWLSFRKADGTKVSDSDFVQATIQP